MIANEDIFEMMQRRDDVVIECESCPKQIRIPLTDWQESTDPRAAAGWCQVRNLAKQYEDYCPECTQLFGFTSPVTESLLFGKPASFKRDRDNLYRLYQKDGRS